MGAAATDDDAFDWRAADAAGLAGARVDVVVELEEASDAVCVYIIGDRRAAKLNSFGQDLDECGAESGEFCASETTGVAGGADAGVEECLVGVDVADAVEQGLVEQRGLDGGFAVSEESDEVFEGDGEGFDAGTDVFLFPRGGSDDGETAEASSVDEAKLLSAAQSQNGVSVERDWGIGC